MTFFLHHDGFPKVACVVRDGTVAGICLFWFPEQPIFTLLSSQTEESSDPALAGLVLQMREDLPLDSYIVICWHLPLDPHFPKVKKLHNHKNPDNEARTVNLKNETEFSSDIW